MNWYLAKIVFQINCGNGLHTGQFDEQLRLIAAENKEDAFQKAQSIGKQEEEIFINQKQQLVQWKFINVSALYKFTEMIDGAELFSRIEERDDTEEYIQIINKKAEHILSNNTLEILELA